MAIKRAIKAGDKSIISFKKVIKVGEITQWFDKDKFSPSQTDRTLTFTNNGDGSVTVSGVVVNTTRSIYSISNLKELIKGHKYLLSGCPYNDTDSNFLSLNVYGADGALLEMYYDYGLGLIFTFNQEYYNRGVGGIYIYERSVGVEINRTYTPQLFDLTEMFGAGHEPATVSEFRAKFPETYYPYQRAVLTVYNKVVRPCARKGEVVQLVNPIDFGFTTQTVNGITFTNNNDGSVTINGTANSDTAYRLIINRDKIINGYVYLYGSEQNTNDYGVAWGTSLPQNSTYGIYSINNNYTIIVKNGVTVNNVTIFPQIYNLTAMYGKGNEPKTLAEFRKDFPKSYYPYSPIQTKNLWTCNKTAYFYKYDKTTQIYTITGTGSASCYTLPTPLPVGETFTISVRCLSGELPSDCTVNFGGYHLQGSSSTWQTTVSLPREQDLTGRVFTATEKTTDTLTDFWIFIYAKIPTNLRVMIQFEKGSVATDYVPHDYI